MHAKPIMWVMNPSESLKTRDNLKFFVGWVVSVAKLRKHGIWNDGVIMCVVVIVIMFMICNPVGEIKMRSN